MKKMNLFAQAIMMVLCMGMGNIIFAACSEDYSSVNRIEDIVPEPEPDPTPDPTDDPTDDPDEPTIPTEWRWNVIADQTVSFNPATEWVESNNISLLARENGSETETKLDSATLRYQFGIVVSAPIRVVTEASDTTVYTGKGRDNVTYGEFYCQGTDSLRTVTTNVVGGFQTKYYTIGLTTNRTEGYSLQGGKWVPYKNVTETSVMSSIWHEPMVEIELNDSIFNRETVHNCITITLKGDKMQTWMVKREKVVIVDHFLKKIEEEPTQPEPEKVKADFWVPGLGRLVSLTKCLREDTRLWCDVALIEGSTGYTMIIDTYSTDGKFVGREVKNVSFGVCPRSNDYDGVGYINGGFYPGAIEYDYKNSNKDSHDWVVTCYINGNVKQQAIQGGDAVSRGIKNFKENNTAYPWPYMTNTSTSKEVNGKKVITVTGKTSTRAYKGCIVADSSLK